MPMKKSLGKRLLFLIFSFVLLLSALSVGMNYQNFVSTMEESSYSTAHMVAETCALITDGDKLDSYIKTGQRDTYYYEMWNKLIDYRNTNEDIVQLMIGWFDENGLHYIYDTDLTENGAFLDDIEAMDAEQEKRVKKLVRGEDVGYITYPDRIVVYRPVQSSYNLHMGYVIVGISTAESKRDQYQYLLRLILAVLVLTLAVSLWFILRINHTVIRPINKLSTAAASYKDAVGTSGEDSPLAQLQIHTGDEIEVLFHSLCKMESDILDSSNSLAIATWNSYHDSMTQLFNKRYLENCRVAFESKTSVGIVYFDIDNLKKMNDICGHESGDEVIIKTADFIRKHQTGDNPGFRMGGDEFMLVVCDKTAEEMQTLEAVMKSDPQTVLTAPEKEVQCRIAIGYAYQQGSIDLEKLIEEADQNMYKDKQSHR